MRKHVKKPTKYRFNDCDIAPIAKAIQHLRYLRSLWVGPAYWLVHRDSHFINDDHLQYSKDSMTPHIHQPTGVLNIAHLGRICSWKLCWRFKWGRWTRPRINHWRFNRWTLWLDSQFIGLVYGKKIAGNPIFDGTTMVSCRFSLKPIHWPVDGCNRIETFWSPTSKSMEIDMEVS